jgi:GTPase SAR1 family protein
MAFIDHDARTINFKLVYWGPGLCGKTTNLQYVFHRTHPDHRSTMTGVGVFETLRVVAEQIVAPRREHAG